MYLWIVFPFGEKVERIKLVIRKNYIKQKRSQLHYANKDLSQPSISISHK